VRGRLRAGMLLAAAALAAAACLRRSSGAGPVESADSQPAFLGLKLLNVTQVAAKSFPGARPGKAVMSRAMAALKPYGVKRGNTIYGTSICSDEINGDAGHFPALMGKFFGKTFPLGGIGGAPYVGKTGFGAFSHHVPDDGHVLIVFGPHIGISVDGEPGKFLRDGQHKHSTACGAVIAAYQQVSSGMAAGSDPSDVEQAWLRGKLRSACGEVAASDDPMVALVMKAYKAVEEEMLNIVNTDFGSGNLILIGGIQINMPYPLPGYFAPLHFSVRSWSHDEPEDLLEAFD